MVELPQPIHPIPGVGRGALVDAGETALGHEAMPWEVKLKGPETTRQWCSETYWCLVGNGWELGNGMIIDS